MRRKWREKRIEREVELTIDLLLPFQQVFKKSRAYTKENGVTSPFRLTLGKDFFHTLKQFGSNSIFRYYLISEEDFLDRIILSSTNMTVKEKKFRAKAGFCNN